MVLVRQMRQTWAVAVVVAVRLRLVATRLARQLAGPLARLQPAASPERAQATRRAAVVAVQQRAARGLRPYPVLVVEMLLVSLVVQIGVAAVVAVVQRIAGQFTPALLVAPVS